MRSLDRSWFGAVTERIYAEAATGNVALCDRVPGGASSPPCRTSTTGSAAASRSSPSPTRRSTGSRTPCARASPRRSIARAADPAVRAIVLTGAGGLFSGGADIREFGTPASTAEPTLRQVIDRVETGAKPVVAAIDGTCLGGGLELAMAAHYRVASATARLGLPEVKLGLIPGAGGTARLPRLVGVERAVEMITTGEPVAASALSGTRLLDRVVDGDPLPAAIDLASAAGRGRRTAESPRPADRLGDISPRLSEPPGPRSSRSARRFRRRAAQST